MELLEQTLTLEEWEETISIEAAEKSSINFENILRKHLTNIQLLN